MWAGSPPGTREGAASRAYTNSCFLPWVRQKASGQRERAFATRVAENSKWQCKGFLAMDTNYKTTSVVISTPRPETKRKLAGSAIHFFEPQKRYSTTETASQTALEHWAVGTTMAWGARAPLRMPSQARPLASTRQFVRVLPFHDGLAGARHQNHNVVHSTTTQHNTSSLPHYVKLSLPMPSSRTFL